MCESCVAPVCYGGCPFYEKQSRAAVCVGCGEPIATGETVYVGGGGKLCSRCAGGLSALDLVDLGGLYSLGDLLALLGYRQEEAGA